LATSKAIRRLVEIGLKPEGKAEALARSTIDLLTLLKAVGDHRASFQSLGEQWVDTTTAAGRLMLTILGGLAEFRARTD
jgi:DNA invertase Pin-like site-specific DNA recombinase